MRKKRVMLFFLGVLLLLGALGVRIGYLELVKGEKYLQAAVTQREATANIEPVRGDFYARGMKPLTNTRIKTRIAVLSKDLSEKEKEILKNACDYEGEIHTVPMVLDLKNQDCWEKDTANLSAFQSRSRYGEGSLARHLLGYTQKADGNGVTGLERTYDSILNTGRWQKLSYIKGADGAPIPSLGAHAVYEERANRNLLLTLDEDLQKAAEEAADRLLKQGALVVTEAATGDVLAVLSRPHYEQDGVEAYLESGGTELLNRAEQAYDVGSVFKICVAAAALTEGIVTPETKFHCSGSVEVDGMTFPCHKKEGHGELTFSEALGFSCNIAFIEVGQALGPEKILDMAKKLGFGTSGGGFLPQISGEDKRATANLSIGQGELLVTPMQVADMMTTLAGGGIRKRLNIVDSIVDNSGRTVQKIKDSYSERVLSPEVAAALNMMLQGTFQYGTAGALGIENAAGKTGSAESGWTDENGEPMVQAWLVGYFPADAPKYTLTVLYENGESGSGDAGPLFREVWEWISKRM